MRRKKERKEQEGKEEENDREREWLRKRISEKRGKK